MYSRKVLKMYSDKFIIINILHYFIRTNNKF